MAKCLWIFFLGLRFASSLAQSPLDAIAARNEALNALRSFNPAAVLKDFNENPNEASLHPGEGTDSLKAKGFNSLVTNEIAKGTYQQGKLRESGLKVRPNPESPEMRFAESLLEHPELVLEGSCYKVKGDCKTQSITKTCEESLHYKSFSCKETLKVKVSSSIEVFHRLVPYKYGLLTVNLTVCTLGDWFCQSRNTITLKEHCEALLVQVSRAGQSFSVIKQPTCSDPTVMVQIPFLMETMLSLQIAVKEWVSEESVSKTACDSQSNPQCSLDGTVACLEPNAVKQIDGVSVTRPCWGKEFNYQCVAGLQGNCQSLMDTGCSQSASTCMEAKANRCERYLQTFQCIDEFCEPDKTVCPGKIGCADGECDTSHTEDSKDMGEGVSRLGALAGVAGDAALNQTQAGVASIFAGENFQCRTLVARLGNCCDGKARLLNCSAKEKALAKAKEEGRAFKIGTYCALKVLFCEKEKESWCVFPTQLSSIVQIQGRFNQLKIPFGEAHDETNAPDCRGLKPEELERIDFSKLNLKPLETELMARQVFPNNAQINGSNQGHIERLNEAGKAYD